MQDTKYTHTVRGHLCQLLTKSRDNYKAIMRIHEKIEDVEMSQELPPILSTTMVKEELIAEIEFLETLNDLCSAEINRLVPLVLKNQTEI